MQVGIKRTPDRVPRGMMTVPLLTGSLAAAANPNSAAAPATVLVASCVIVTSLAVPLLTAWWAGRVRQPVLQAVGAL